MTVPQPRLLIGALTADLVAVIAFAAAGRQSHEADGAVALVLVIAWPFALAALLAHAGLPLAGVQPASLRAGLAAVGTTYAVGMALRGLSGRGLDPAFLVVALLSLVVLMLGWRGVRRLVSGRLRTRAA